MHTYNEGQNTKPAVCRECGQPLDAGDGIVYSVWGYPWDGSDGEGSITKELSRYTICQNATQCAERVVAHGTNTGALRVIASDRENLGDLASQAQAILVEIAEMHQKMMLGEDLTAREAGYGAIGGYRG